MSGDFRIEDFKDLKKIGSGGFGDVYKAVYSKDGRKLSNEKESDTNEVALKMVKPSVDFNKVLNEYETQKKLHDHPNIVKLYGYFKNSENMCWCIVMELCKYGDLRKYVKDKGPLPPHKAAKILKQLVCALIKMHKNNVMHRDISPGNVLISRNEHDLNDAPTVKITDFGLARELQRNAPAKTYVGTPGYMADEVTAGRGYGMKGDNFSLGSLLFFMLSGREPAANERLDFTSYKQIPSSAVQLIQELRAPERDRIALNDVMSTHFMEEYIGINLTGTSVERSRNRGASRSGSHRREASSSVDRQRRSEPPFEPLQRRSRADSQNVDYGYAREPYRSRGVDSGFRSSRTSSQPPSVQPSAPPVYNSRLHNDSVANGFNVKWPINPRRLLTQEMPTREEMQNSFRAIINTRGDFTIENFNKEGFVDNIVRITFNPRQKVEILRPRKRIPAPRSKRDPQVLVEEPDRVYIGLQALERNGPDFSLYKNACRKLWLMSRDVIRVGARHPNFPWAYCRLMENGDLRILPDKQHQNYDKLTRKGDKDALVYKRVTFSDQTFTITDGKTIREMDQVYEMLIDYENIALKNGLQFPVNISSGPLNAMQTPMSTQNARLGFSQISLPKASVASAPATMYNSRPQPFRSTENIQRNLPPSSADKFSHKSHPANKNWMSITDDETGATLRTSTANQEEVIFRPRKNAPEQRFYYKDTPSIPPAAVGLVHELIRCLKTQRN